MGHDTRPHGSNGAHDTDQSEPAQETLRVERTPAAARMVPVGASTNALHQVYVCSDVVPFEKVATDFLRSDY